MNSNSIKNYHINALNIDLSSNAIKNNLKTNVYNANIDICIYDETISVSYNYSSQNSINPEFITNFLVKESYYRDKLTKNFSGETLVRKLEDFDFMIAKEENQLLDIFSKSIGDFFNNIDPKDNEILDQNNEKQYNNTQEFSAGLFKDHIIHTINIQKNLLDAIKNENFQKWNDILNSKVTNLGYFIEKLKALSITSIYINSHELENMSYSDITSVSEVIASISQYHIYSFSSTIFGSYLGQKKLKSHILINSLPLSSSVKDSLIRAIDKYIHNKIKDFQSLYSNIPGNSDTKLVAAFDSFANLSKTTDENFSKDCSQSFKRFLSFLKDENTYLPEQSKYRNKDAYAYTLINAQVYNWNTFVRTLIIDTAKKHKYYIQIN